MVLNVEATAPDGIVEAVSVKGAKAFAFGTQWHPEFKAAGNPDSVKLFTAFGDAVRAHARARGETHYRGAGRLSTAVSRAAKPLMKSRLFGSTRTLRGWRVELC